MIRIISTLTFGLWFAAAGVASAQDVDEKAMERKIRNLGFSIGNAYACTAKEKRQAFRRESHHLFDLIVQDVGSDLAFVYATSVGAGSGVPQAKLDCPKLLKQWEGIREDYELKGDEG